MSKFVPCVTSIRFGDAVYDVSGWVDLSDVYAVCEAYDPEESLLFVRHGQKFFRVQGPAAEWIVQVAEAHSATGA